VSVWALVIALLLLVANAMFVGAEFALIASRSSKIERLAEAGDRRARVALRSSRELSFMLSAAQLGITMASLGLGYVAEPALAHIFEDLFHGFSMPSGLSHSIAFAIALLIVSFFHMVFGEMAPKNIAISDPEKSALLLAFPFRAYAVLFKPFIWFFNTIGNAGTRLLGIEPQDERSDVHTASEIGLIITESAKGGLLDRFEHRLLSGAASFGERDAGSAMVPRTELVAVPADISSIEMEGVVVASGHTRIPVYEGDLDNILGFFHSKDLLRIPPERYEAPIPRTSIRPMLVVPESKKLHPLLLEMRRERKHVSLVIEEHGGTAGVITMEDLLEELVGEIRDEYDVAELGVERLSESRYLVPGSLRIDEIKDRLGIELPEGEYETIAGFLMRELGHIPRRRDTVTHDEWRLRVISMHRRRVVQVLIEQH
jgi:CBS domain containing-hemolysin-like protein